MYVLQLAKLSGAEMTIAIGRTEDKLRMAQENFGGDEIINITTEKLRDGIKWITSGKGVDIVFDCVVNNDTIDSSLKILADSGKLVIVGVNKDPVYFNPITLTMKEASIAGSFVGTKYELQMRVDLAMVGKLKEV
jgi:threonine dehydrogenase-like Zn-dependent dehydrogenase